MAGNQNPGYPNVVAGRAASGNTPTDIFMDPTAGALYTGIWVWNASSMIWEKMTQPKTTDTSEQYVYDDPDWVEMTQPKTSDKAETWVWSGSAWVEQTQPKTTDNANLYGYNGTNWQNVRLDQSTRSLQTIEYEHHEIHGGSTYKMFRADTLATNDVIQLYWSTPASDKEQHVVFEWYGAGAVSVVLLEDISYSSGGAVFTGVNHYRRGTPGVSNCTLKVGSDGALTDPISYTGGTTLFQSNTGSGRQVPGGGSHSEEFVFERELEYLLELTAGGNGIICDLSATWYEHTPKAA